VGFSFLAWTFSEAGAADPMAGGVQHFINESDLKKECRAHLMKLALLFSSVPRGRRVAASHVFADLSVVHLILKGASGMDCGGAFL